MSKNGLEVNSSLKAEGLKAKKKNNSRPIKVMNMETLIAVIQKALYDLQKQDRTSNEYFKNLGYLAQTYKSIEALNMEIGYVDKIIGTSVIKLENKYSLQINSFFDMISKKIGQEAVEEIIKDYNKIKKDFDNGINAIKSDIIEKINQVTKYGIKNHSSLDDESWTESIKYIIDKLSQEKRREVLEYCKLKGYDQ